MREVEALIDLDSYPVHELDRGVGWSVVEAARKTFDDTSLVVLDGFLRPAAIRRITEQSLAAAGRQGFRFSGSNDIYLGTEPTADGSADSGRAYTKTTVAFDRIDSASPLRALYGWEPLTRFIEAVVGAPVHRSADPLGAMTVHVHHDGDEQDWHFDVSEYTVVLHIHAPQAGGVLQYVARSRSELAQDHTLLREIAAGRRHAVARDLPTVPGTLVLHAGRVSMHRVTPVRGPDPRISATLSYNTAPGLRLNEYTRRLYFGRDQ
ncbi:HalD/BesD family halogenase [Streptomyces sp. NPDC003042]